MVVPAVGVVVVADEAEGVAIVVEIAVSETVACAVDCALLVVFTTSCVGEETPSVNVACADAADVVVSVVAVFKKFDVDAAEKIVVCVDVFSLVVFAWHPHRIIASTMHRQNKRFNNGTPSFLDKTERPLCLHNRAVFG